MSNESQSDLVYTPKQLKSLADSLGVNNFTDVPRHYIIILRPLPWGKVRKPSATSKMTQTGDSMAIRRVFTSPAS
jgi:hypothetical protein